VTARDRRLRYTAVLAWARLNPRWDVRFLNTTSATKLAPIFGALSAATTGTSGRGDASRPRVHVCASWLADLLRLELLTRYGGVWADTAVVPMRPLDDWLPAMLGPPGVGPGFWSPFGWSKAAANLSRTAVAGIVDEREKAKSEAKAKDMSQVRKRIPGGRFGCYSLPLGKVPITSRCSGHGVTWVFNQSHLYMTAMTWFLAAREPHQPLVEAWFAYYADSLLRAVRHLLPAKARKAVHELGVPYYIALCTLVAIQDKHEGVHLTMTRMRAPCGGARAYGSRHDRRPDRAVYMYKLGQPKAPLNAKAYVAHVQSVARGFERTSGNFTFDATRRAPLPVWSR